MSKQYEPERPDSVREINRVCYSKQCGGLLRPQRMVIYWDEDNYTCLVCGRMEHVKHTNEGDAELSQAGWSDEQIERARREVMSVAGDVQTHHWGKLGKKDRGFIGRIIDRLIGVGRDLDKK